MYKKDQLSNHVMLLPAVVIVFLFNTMTLIGIFVAFQDFVPNHGWFGSEWVGLRNFQMFFRTPDFLSIMRNTFCISIGKIVVSTVVAIAFALVLNEIQSSRFKRCIQTVVYLPHFVSWVIFATVLRLMLKSDGMVNRSLMSVAGMQQPIMFLGKASIFQGILILTDTLKEFGFGAVVYLAAITAINPTFYEAATIDGANRFQMMTRITLPCIMPTIVLLATLSIGSVLSAGFDQVFNLYSPAVYETGDIIDTYVYRVGLININYGLGSAIGLLKSLVSFVLIVASYTIAAKVADYRII